MRKVVLQAAVIDKKQYLCRIFNLIIENKQY